MMGGGGQQHRGLPTQPNAEGAPGTFAEPPVLVSRNGLLDATLSSAPALIPYESGNRWALTVNGTTPGPTLRVRPGDRLRLVLDNRMSQATNLHTHGLHVSPKGNADNPFLEVGPGARFTYEIDIPLNHPGGLFWYHPHLHHRVAAQLFAGFFGAIIVEDAFDRLPEVANARERLLILHDVRPGTTQGTVMDASPMEQMAGREGSVVMVNGSPFPEIGAVAGQLERWRILNASPSRFYRLDLKGHQLWPVGVDGGRVEKAQATDSLDLVPGERVEVLVQPTAPGTYVLGTSAVDRGSVGMGMGRGRQSQSGAASLARLVVAGERAPAARIPELMARIDNLAGARVDRTRELTFSMQGMAFRIDGREFDPSRVDIRAALGALEEWTVRNSSTMDHPFHLHVWPFQVVAQSKGTPSPGWKDVVNVPAGGWVRMRVRFDDFTGKSVYHCHILDHEDMGMMGTIEVV
jgi:FtsP/CotA-like multicopper oxidase with cupredoxin domain